MTEHWAVKYIGRAYVDGGMGPDSFNCWGLVRWALEHELDTPMPLINVGETTNEGAIREATERGWRPCHALPETADVLLMNSPTGKHVALALVLDGQVQALHALEETGVVLTPLQDLWMMGFKDVTVWRKA